MVTLADNFDRANSSTSLGSTSTGAVPWSALSGTWGILTNRGYVAVSIGGGGQNEAVVDTGSADGTTGVKLATVGAAAFFGLCFRATDASNHYVFEGSNGTRARVYKKVAGAYTLLGQSAENVYYASLDLIEVVLSGSSITVKRNGATLVALSDATYTTQTKHGLHLVGSSSSNSTYFDDFVFTDPAGVAITGTLNAVLPKLTASLTGTYVVGTDVSNRDWARRRGGMGLVTVEVPVAPVPPTRTRAPRVTKAVPLPTPTMVDGRPT